MNYPIPTPMEPRLHIIPLHEVPGHGIQIISITQVGEQLPSLQRPREEELTWLEIDSKKLFSPEDLQILINRTEYYGIKLINFVPGDVSFFDLVHTYITTIIKFTHLVLMDSSFYSDWLEKLMILRTEVKIVEINNLTFDSDYFFHALATRTHVTSLIIRNIKLSDATSFIVFLGKNTLERLSIDHVETVFPNNPYLFYREMFNQLMLSRGKFKYLTIARDKFNYEMIVSLRSFLKAYVYVFFLSLCLKETKRHKGVDH